jgi:hypothetical protein
MKSYIGTKIIRAEEMDENTFISTIKNNGLTPDQDNQPGYLVEYADGYKSWSPKATFEEAYRPVSEREKALI